MTDKYNLDSLWGNIIEDLSIEIPEMMKKYSIPGIAIAITSKEQAIWTNCFGYTDITNNQEVNKDTIFSLQSTSKTVTTVAFLLAVHNGLVNLDDPITKYYPEFTMKCRFGDNIVKKITFFEF